MAARAWQRNASVLLWTPVLLLGPVLDLAEHWSTTLALLVVVVLGCAVTIGRTARPVARSATPYVALTTMVAAVFGAAAHANAQWLPTWVLVANAVPVVLRGRALMVAVPAVVGGSMWAAWMVEPHQWSRVWLEAFVVLLAALASTAFVRLLDTVAELRRTRRDLARASVAEERERISRDLHDLLGHSLSVMVVKAEAVRRLSAIDPTAAAAHAADIETVGRTALLEVRQAVDAMRAPTLAEELVRAEQALTSAGIATDIDAPGLDRLDDATPLAWALREGVTNVLRHSGADRCRIAVVDRDGRTELVVDDNGSAAPTAPRDRAGGLGGLRDRIGAAGGSLDAVSTGSGFRLTARVPRQTP
jgi:two-component system, NarL family, sensor histidine kinase DesK